MTFEEAFEKSKKEKPGLGTYLHLCNVLGESGASMNEVTKHFDDTMGRDEYLKSERRELLDYLFKIANNQPL